MKDKEIIQIILAIATLGIVYGFNEIAEMNLNALSAIIGFSAIIIGINILSKKIVASRLDADVEHEIWQVKRFGFHPGDNFKKSISAGILIPLFVTLVTLGSIAPMTVMTYETRALKRRAAKRFGPYSFTEMTDFHNALVGAIGIISCLLITFLTYWIPGDSWSAIGKMATFYAFYNLLPISKLDGSQIFFGSRVLWSVLAVITLIFMSYAIFLV
ncbi:hypothetical protein J4423_05175 [Candidatus Pacearchaeota archaeon]|nr:hypothetical protein [Candidatus Pacearchaeota archaeon]